MRRVTQRVFPLPVDPTVQALFRFDMKENNENSTKLCNIPLSTFELILQTLYTGHNLITVDNFGGCLARRSSTSDTVSNGTLREVLRQHVVHGELRVFLQLAELLLVLRMF
ncbi:hypothetical protein Btru_073987 [Bulinus truncatus]|nr:hypothetical protein Btru_073987 [Bulinus truncatus]